MKARRTIRVPVNLTPKEARALATLATANGLPVATQARELLRHAIKAFLL